MKYLIVSICTWVSVCGWGQGKERSYFERVFEEIQVWHINANSIHKATPWPKICPGMSQSKKNMHMKH